MKRQVSAPISTRQQFSAGGNMVPIVTRSSAQSVAGVQQMGYSVGKTTLGAYRMGEGDGNGPASAIYPNDIFAPLPARDRKEKEVMFTSVGFRTFQPPADDDKLHALLKKFGDQQFKATESAPFEEYFRTKELARQTDELARMASVEDQGVTREIMRNLVDARRQSSEADFLRRMVDAGLSPEAAQMEVDNVRRASALQEARTVDDRPYQQKLLISRIAQSRGLASQVRDPLTQSAGISDPQNSQDGQLAMGGSGGFGVGVERQAVTPEFYSRFGRRMPETKEAQDQQAAVNFLISRGAAGEVTSATQLEGLDRAEAIQKTREGAASKLETLRNRGNKIMLPLPGIGFFSEPLLRQVYGGRKPGEETYFTTEDSQSLTTTQAVVAMNQLLSDPAKVRQASQLLRESRVPILKPDQTASANLFEILRTLVGALAGGGTIQLPFVGKTIDLSVASGNYEALGTALDRIKTSGAPARQGGSNAAAVLPVPEPEGEDSPSVRVREKTSDEARARMPPKKASAQTWKEWAEMYAIPLPHSKTSLVSRFR